MNKEVLADKRISTMTRIENALNCVKGEARSYASLVRALWDTRRSRAALPGSGDHGICDSGWRSGCYSNYRHYGIPSQNSRVVGCDLFWDQRALGLSDLSAGNV